MTATSKTVSGKICARPTRPISGCSCSHSCPTNWTQISPFTGASFDNAATAYGHRTAILNADGLGEFGGPADVDFGGYVDNDGDFYAGDFGSPGPNDAEGWIATINLDYAINDSTRLVSVTNFQNHEKDYQEDSDSSPADFGDFLTQQDADDFAQEIRLEGSNDSLDWTAGLYYLNIDGDYRVSFNFPDYFGYSIFPNNLYSLETTSWAVFGQVEYQMSDRLTLVAGLRWTDDDKDFESVVTCDDFGAAPLNNGCDDFGLLLDDVSPFDLSRSDSDYTGKLQLDFAVNDNTLLYAGINRGMKAGGFLGSIDAGATVPELQFEPEILHSFEAGFKTSFADGRARLNGSAFVYDYEDYQAFVFQGITSVIVNKDAEITGAELELIAQPGEGWDLLLGVSMMDATVEDIDIGGGVLRDQQMVLAPDVSMNFLGRKEWQVGSGSLAVQLDGYYSDKQQFNSINSEAAANESYSVWNARVTYTPNDNWQIYGFVKKPHRRRILDLRLRSRAVFRQCYSGCRGTALVRSGIQIRIRPVAQSTCLEVQHDGRDQDPAE